jgi:uncharacterized membrane protein
MQSQRVKASQTVFNHPYQTHPLGNANFMNDPKVDREDPEATSFNQPPSEPEPIWSFRGYRLRAGEFTTAMVHFFRAEVQRANVWRNRLDTTTNWAVISTGASLTIAFSQSGFHGVILMNALLVTVFLSIEARRYRYYELWSSRVRLMETDFFAAMLVPPFQPSPDWAESLAENLLHPQFPISILEALGRRLRRNYLYIYAILAIAWLAKVALIPNSVKSWHEFTYRSAIGGISGETVTFVVFFFIITLIVVGLLTVRLQHAPGEILPRFATEIGLSEDGTSKATADTPTKPWYRLSKRRQQLMALIITDRANAVGNSILNELKRGVTALEGKGMYTGAAHSILMCALTITEVNHLKKVVNDTDPNAFVIVTPAQEVLGRGFMPLNTE